MMFDYLGRGACSSQLEDKMEVAQLLVHCGPRELGGGVDLINHYNLRPIHELFCKRSLPSSTSETHYLQNVVGETVIRKGEGMELDQLLQKTSSVGNRRTNLRAFDFHILREAFHMGEPTPAGLPYAEKGRSGSSLKLNGDSKHKKKHKTDKTGEDTKDVHHKCNKLNKDGDEIRYGHREFGSIHLKIHKDKQKNLKAKKSAKPRK